MTTLLANISLLVFRCVANVIKHSPVPFVKVQCLLNKMTAELHIEYIFFGFYAYVVNGFDGLEIIDISNPSAPSKVGQFYDGGSAIPICNSKYF